MQSRSVYRHSYHPTKPLLSMSIILGDRFRIILGEAIMPSVGPDAEQILGFATDSGVHVEHENSESTTEMLSIEHKSDGYRLQLTMKSGDQKNEVR